MGSLTLGHNAVSHRLRTQLNRTTNAYAQNLQRLSSGSRINRASDDAAGLAVATKLGAQTRIYGQAIRNLNDGISALNVAEGGLGQMHIIATRLREVAEQSANGSFTSAQRAALNEEAGALISEYNRITGSTTFNNRQLLDGTLSNLALQLGFSSVSVSVGSNISQSAGNGTFGAAITTGSGARATGPAVGDINGDGFDDNVSIRNTSNNNTTIYIQLSNGDGTFTESTRTLTATNGQSVEIGDLNNDGKLDIVVYGYRDLGGGSYTMRADRLLGNGDGTFGTGGVTALNSFLALPTQGAFQLADVTGDGNLDIVDSYTNPIDGLNYVAVRPGNGTGGFALGTSYLLSAAGIASEMRTVDLNGDNRLDLVFTDGTAGYQMLNNGSGGFSTAETQIVADVVFGVDTGDIDGNGTVDVVFSGSSGSTVYLSSGTGSNPLSLAATLSGASSAVGLSDLNGDGNLDVVTGSSTFMGNGDGTFGSGVSHTAPPSLYWDFGDVNNDGVDDIVSGNTAGVSVLLGTKATTTTQAVVSIATQEEALEALDTFSTLMDNLSREIGNVGGTQSRLRHALGNLFVTRDGYGVAASRIRDADIAQEAALMVRNQVLQSTDQALLAQANQSSELVLSLLSEVENLPGVAI